jgi:hypothetical protein
LLSKFSLKLQMFCVMQTVLLPKELISVLAIYMGILNMSMKVSNIESFLYMWIG